MVARPSLENLAHSVFRPGLASLLRAPFARLALPQLPRCGQQTSFSKHVDLLPGSSQEIACALCLQVARLGSLITGSRNSCRKKQGLLLLDWLWRWPKARRVQTPTLSHTG